MFIVPTAIMWIPKRSSTRELLAHRMPEHLLRHVVESISKLPLPHVNIVLHGGEPLLLQKSYLERLFQDIGLNRPEKEVNIQLQTNGVLIDKDWIKLFCDYKIGVGISIDGPKYIHDLYRKNLGQLRHLCFGHEVSGTYAQQRVKDWRFGCYYQGNNQPREGCL